MSALGALFLGVIIGANLGFVFAGLFSHRDEDEL